MIIQFFLSLRPKGTFLNEMKRHLLFLLGIFVMTMLVFALAKVIFMLCNLGSQDFVFGDMVNVLTHGFSLDFSTSLYVLSFPLLAVMASVWVKLPKWVWNIYFLLIAIAMSLAFVADVSLYEFWHFKLDASCLQYLETPTEAMASVTWSYLMVRVLAFLGVTGLIFVAYRSVVKTFLTADSHPVSSRPSLTARSIEFLLYLILIPFIVIGIRGGLGESTTNIGQVYYSGNQFLNHAAVNPVFSFLSSIGKSGDYIVSYDYFEVGECQKFTEGLYNTESVDPDTLLNTNRPNIVLIVMESCGSQFTKVGGHPEIMPYLDQLADESVNFTECYANSWRTDKGVVSILSGYPAFPVTSVMKIPEKSRKLASIAASLKDEGYSTSFLYGGDINFTNMRSYVIGTGFDQLTWKADYTREEQQTAQWGVRDDLVFASLLSEIKQELSSHWMKTMLTLSSHEPWDVPTKVLDDEVYNAFNYLDQCIGSFIDSLKQLPVWDNLLVVIMPDHGFRYKGIDETTRLYNHIPMIWTGGAIREPRKIEAVCNQSDLAATLLGQLQIDHSAFTFSRDVMGKQYEQPFAYHTYNNGVTIIDSLGFMAYDLDVERIIAQEGDSVEHKLQRARALLQITSADLIEK